MAKAKQKEKSPSVSIKIEWILVAVLAVLLVLSVITAGYTELPFNLNSPLSGGLFGKKLSTDEIKERVTTYVNEDLLGGQSTAEITEVTEDEASDMYKVIIKIGEQEYESFVSKDGKYLYTQRNEITSSEEKLAEYTKSDTPEVLLFTMSYCPYGNQAEDFVKPVSDLLGSKTNIIPHYVIYQDYASRLDAEWNEYCLDKDEQYCSMHGVQELNQDVRELCTFKYQPDKYWDFVMSANENCDAENVDECWEQIAKDAGIDTEKIKTCEAEEAETLLAEEVKLNEEYEVTGSPTILLNGENYSGNRTAEDFKQAVCASFNEEPEECSQTIEGSEESAPEGSCN